MADILICDMDMPKNGYVEMLLKIADGEVYYNYAGEREIKAADYIPLPEGHGRLIDADNLLQSLGDLSYKGSVRRVLSSAPTVIPAEGGESDGN